MCKLKLRSDKVLSEFEEKDVALKLMLVRREKRFIFNTLLLESRQYLAVKTDGTLLRLAFSIDNYTESVRCRDDIQYITDDKMRNKENRGEEANPSWVV